MTANHNVEKLREIYAEWDRSKGANTDIWLDLVGDEFELFSICGGRDGAEFTARCTCAEEVKRYLGGLTGQWQMQSAEMTDYIADGDRVVAIGRHVWTNRATGRTVDTAKCDVWTFRDGKAVAFAEFYDSHALIEAART